MDLDMKRTRICNVAKASYAAPLSTHQSSFSAKPHCQSACSMVKKAPISSLLPAPSPLHSSEQKVVGKKCLNSNFSGVATITSTKPLWAPQENDAPLNLTLEVDPNKDIVCQLCGAWFETRKGLSSHARAHLRHFGLECSESKSSPIDLLNQLIYSDNFKMKPRVLQPESAPRASVPGPPAKRHKSSCIPVFHLSGADTMTVPHSEAPKEIGCEFCGEYFENRKGLSSHARSHLRQMGITEWSVNGSPIDTLRDVMTRQGQPFAFSIKSIKKTSPSSPGASKSSLLASSSSLPVSLLSRVSSTCIQPLSLPQPLAVSKSNSLHSDSCSNGLTIKLKPEPAQLEVTLSGPLKRSHGFPSGTLNWSSSDSVFPLNLAMVQKPEPQRDIRCEFCGEYFENRKGLSSHARSHLRQMGITVWSVNGSPIDTLREVMMKKCEYSSSLSDLGLKKETGQELNILLLESPEGNRGSQGLPISSCQLSKFHKSPLKFLQSKQLHKGLPKGLASTDLASTSAASSAGKFFRFISPVKRTQCVETDQSASPQLKAISSQSHDFCLTRKSFPDKPGLQDPSCELCGFFFENRKALASHARAHLRQFGVTEWSVNGSPIETLSAWMRTRPKKVLEMHRRYTQIKHLTLKKKDSCSTRTSSFSQWSSSLAVSLVQEHSGKAVQDSLSNAERDSGFNHLARKDPKCIGLPQVAHSELNVRLPRGFERRPLKHPTCPDETESHSGPARMPRRGTVPALVPKPPSYPLVKMVGKYYTLKCRFCEVEFHGLQSVQENWIRHLQEHIFKMNYSKPPSSKLGLPK